MSQVAMPYRIGAGGRTDIADHRGFVESIILQVMFVEPGERVNRPDFGCALRALVFAGGRSELVTAVEAMAQSALRQWASDVIHVQGVDVAVLEDVIQVTVRYVDIASRTAHEVIVTQ